MSDFDLAATTECDACENPAACEKKGRCAEYDSPLVPAAARDLAAAVIPCICGDGHDPPPHSRLCLESRIAALERQADDAQAARRAEVHVARAMRDVMAERDEERARAVRAEEALRQACEALNDVTTAPTLTEAHLIAALARDDIHSAALAASGADTEPGT